MTQHSFYVPLCDTVHKVLIEDEGDGVVFELFNTFLFLTVKQGDEGGVVEGGLLVKVCEHKTTQDQPQDKLLQNLLEESKYLW